VPIHAGLHWSLAIVCHPGALPPQPREDASGCILLDGDEPAAAAPPRQPQPAPAPDGAGPSAPPEVIALDSQDAAGSGPPAADAGAAGAAGASAAAAAADAAPPAAPDEEVLPYILHCDSMGGGHSTCACPFGFLFWRSALRVSFGVAR
jgi:Ulp1 family protease